MKKMIANQINSERILRIKRYDNGQLAVFIHDNSGKPIAELSIMFNSVELTHYISLKNFKKISKLLTSY